MAFEKKLRDLVQFSTTTPHISCSNQLVSRIRRVPLIGTPFGRQAERDSKQTEQDEAYAFSLLRADIAPRWTGVCRGLFCRSALKIELLDELSQRQFPRLLRIDLAQLGRRFQPKLSGICIWL